MAGPAVPFRQFVLKVASRCDLACDHCYVYEHADQSWRARPTGMSDETIAWSASRIADHAKRHGLQGVTVVLHGGEPLLAGRHRLDRISRELIGALDGVCELDLRIHTNGVLLDESFCDLFAAYGVKIGISLDGDRAANDRHRLYANGRSSYDKVLRAIELVRRRTPELYAGLLCTVDVANDPLAVYEALAALHPPRVDFLLPHATWDAPPPGPPGAYGDWLVRIFDRWLADGRTMKVRLFESALRTIGSETSLTESLGLEPSDLVVIETDGTYEQADSLKTSYDGAPATGFNVSDHSLDTVGLHPGIHGRQTGLAGLCAECRSCPVVSTCGGGLYAHRYRTGTGFANPSVYCADLLKLITHVQKAVTTVDRTAHTLPAADVAALASGYGGAEAIAHVEAGQRSVRRALLAAIGNASTSVEAWRLLTEIDRDAPAALDTVLGHPYVRAWAVKCLRGTADDGHLSSIAATAALHAGVEASVRLPVRDGALHLPGLGLLRVGAVSGATVETREGGFRVHADGLDHDVRLDEPGGPREWSPVRRLSVNGLTVALEDVDLYRDCHQWPATQRLSDQEVERWSRLFSDAWALITRDHSPYAAGLAAGLRAVMPLTPAADGSEVSSTARDAFGAVAVALPADAVTLALLLIHEFQHVKLGALLDMMDLYDQNDTTLYYAPWRDDPRPLEGLLQGTYAHIAVTDFWRVRRLADDGPAAERASVQFARWRAQTAEAVETLAGSGALTGAGQRFVAAMGNSIRPWLAEPIPASAEEEARLAAARHRSRATAQARHGA
ncbi:FxsB family cyclophane-forming radical SAM/SPASM peptide maturase [Sphaerisporangium sp. NPDC051017]|uniref:FxsB family cyclophane-forming radical SAM/SPASM peptide maturase n=1 Tax=Sphaerisporangium sp. NPDC051017 TaxID=3154636 RepID=UPI0034291F78